LAGYRYRPVTPGDLALICRHRREMFRESGRPDGVLQPMTSLFEPWLAKRLADGSYFGWIAEREGEPIGGLGMMVVDWPPHPAHPHEDRRGYILNVFVEAEHRSAGVARTLMDMAEAEGRLRGIGYMFLHATETARPMYERRGWRGTTEMSIGLFRET